MHLLITFFVSLIVNFVIIKSAKFHEKFSGDIDFSGPQKFHKTIIPRVGAIGITIGLCSSLIPKISYSPELKSFFTNILLSSAPILLVGLAEDLTKKVSINKRFIFSILSGVFAYFILGAKIEKVDIFLIDSIFSIQIFKFCITVFAIVGVANAYNIIDGFNGLASMNGIIALLSIAIIATSANDHLIASASLVLASAIAGFFIFNYPKGLIFLGDGGAYSIGFWIACLTIMLIQRNANLSPWLGLTLNAYPILETIFSIYRRKFHQKISFSKADGFHLHTLIYRRMFNSKNVVNLSSKNAMIAPLIWMASILMATLSIVFQSNSILLFFVFFLATTCYYFLYKKIVTFKTPKWINSIYQ